MKEAEDMVDRLPERAGGEREPAVAESGDRLPGCLIARVNVERIAAKPPRQQSERPEAIVRRKLAKSETDSLVSRSEARADKDMVGKLQLLQVAGHFPKVILAQLSSQHREQGSKAVRAKFGLRLLRDLPKPAEHLHEHGHDLDRPVQQRLRRIAKQTKIG